MTTTKIHTTKILGMKDMQHILRPLRLYLNILYKQTKKILVYLNAKIFFFFNSLSI